MALEKISLVKGQGVYVPGNDIDTDRIIPARFMKCITFNGLGEYLFYDIRHDENGEKKDHSLNDPIYADANIMISDANFGCGSSREHAPQSLFRAGFRAVIAGNFAEIFFGNATNLGMPCVSVEDEDRKRLVELLNHSPNQTLSIDLSSLKIRLGDNQFDCDLRKGARDSLLNGTWDPLDELLTSRTSIDRTSNSLGYI
jgi:3-isopropylmalate/(R)-2-methylmalate dehydratase small subunit